MSYYPIFLQIEGMRVLVVGGGNVAQRKVETLLESGASIFIVSKELTPELKRLVDNGDVRFLGEEMKDEFFDDAFIVIAATDDKDLNHKVSMSARRRDLLVNAVDQPEDCNFIVPSVVRRGDLLISISTSGKSPALAKKIRELLEAQFGDEYGAFLNLMGGLRKEVLALGLSQKENRQIFQEIIAGGIIEALALNDWEEIELTLTRILPPNVNTEEFLSGLK
ncbi:MAG: bifunctional precorrin-2 dehydrogenase/sirohydrochlorin ferrochelatase [Desulfobacterales bacterium]|nr:bifunctional precorrin-2 dehydrogenase/sirohydrochlorin ferrochelatase [Desulfobacterales bacterium]